MVVAVVMVGDSTLSITVGRMGLSSTVEGNRLTYDQEVANLRLLVETAADAWG